MCRPLYVGVGVHRSQTTHLSKHMWQENASPRLTYKHKIYFPSTLSQLLTHLPRKAVLI